MIEKIKKAILFRIVNFLYPEIQRRTSRKIDIGKIKKFGPNSFFWGRNHYVSGHENLVIGENVHINDNCHIRAEGGVEIGDNTHISSNLVLYSINHDHKGNSLPYDLNMINKKVRIGKNVWIGINVCIAPGADIGDGCIIGMGTTVSGNVPPLSIVASPKSVIIGKRDENHYNELEKSKRYGAINGQLYNWSSTKKLKLKGDIYFSWRSTSELIQINNDLFVKKTYINTEDGKQVFETELSGLRKFQKYNWCPRLIDSGSNFLIIEYFNNELRLDQFKGEKSKELFADILWCLIDLHNEGYAHRDFHTKNIFITDSGIKIIDFETLINIEPNTDFYESYDFIGNLKLSPFQTNNMCVLSDSESSLSSLFNIKSISAIKHLLNEKVKSEMLNSSVTFKSQIKNKPGGRHTLRDSNIYATFDLKHTKVTHEEGQRNTKKRFEKFNLTEQQIANKTILDIGSNIGGTLLGLASMHPSKMTGWEYDEDKVNLANKITKYNGIQNLEFVVRDVELVNDNELNQFDIVFCLAVVEHLKNKEKLFEVLRKTCNETLYFEGNSNSDVEYIKRQLRLNGFSSIEYLGYSNDEKNQKDNNRPLFIAHK
jgi:acetyltransferase-like isoleucine patch superfamily enzyme/2-polyprenyl-3-methyl-5-hydroxy-6-metoxy-1,4-benzoquinol methylase